MSKKWNEKKAAVVKAECDESGGQRSMYENQTHVPSASYTSFSYEKINTALLLVNSRI